MVHGDHRVVVEMCCSYCKAGLNGRRALGSPRPQGELVTRIENNISNAEAQESKDQPRVDDMWSLLAQPEEQAWDLGDVMNCDFGDGFSLMDDVNTL